MGTLYLGNVAAAPTSVEMGADVCMSLLNGMGIWVEVFGAPTYMLGEEVVFPENLSNEQVDGLSASDRSTASASEKTLDPTP